MVGRTPEYLGKKIESYDVKMAMLYVLIFPLVILVMAAISALTPSGLATLNNAGPHGLSEILYAFSSMAGNNGSAFAGLGPNRRYNIAGGFTMLVGRFLMIVPSGIGRQPGPQKGGTAIGGHLPRDHAVVYRASGKRNSDRGRTDVLPGAEPGTDSRTPADACRKDFLRGLYVDETRQVPIIVGYQDHPPGAD